MKGGLWGVWFLAWLKEAGELHPGDLHAQSLYVRRKAVEKRQELSQGAEGPVRSPLPEQER